MRRAVFLILFAFCLQGCASYSRMFVNAEGDVRDCRATGQGLIGMATASNSVDKCAHDMLAAGYVEMSQAGMLGITVREDPPTPLTILKVEPKSPAAAAGIVPGDLITSVDGQLVSSPRDLRVLLFGTAGQEKKVTFVRDGQDSTYSLKLAPRVQK